MSATSMRARDACAKAPATAARSSAVMTISLDRRYFGLHRHVPHRHLQDGHPQRSRFRRPAATTRTEGHHLVAIPRRALLRGCRPRTTTRNRRSHPRRGAAWTTVVGLGGDRVADCRACLPSDRVRAAAPSGDDDRGSRVSGPGERPQDQSTASTAADATRDTRRVARVVGSTTSAVSVPRAACSWLCPRAQAAAATRDQRHLRVPTQLIRSESARNDGALPEPIGRHVHSCTVRPGAAARSGGHDVFDRREVGGVRDVDDPFSHRNRFQCASTCVGRWGGATDVIGIARQSY